MAELPADLKPDNVLLGSDGRPRVADFGLARTYSGEHPPVGLADAAAADPEPGTEVSASSLLVSPLTQAGAILGTPAYMSAEQHRGEPTDARCDQFSFCAALYEGLYKTLPFAGQTLAELRDNVLVGNMRPPPPRSPVPHKVCVALRRGLAADPAHRFPSMRELLAALAFDPQSDPAASPQSRRSFSRVLVGLMLVVSVAFLPAMQRGAVSPVQEIAAGGILLGGGLLAAFYLRRTLLQNQFHRGTMFLLLVAVLTQISIQGIAALIGLPSFQVLPIGLVCIAATAASLSYFFFHAGWFMQPLLLLSAGWVALHPQDAGKVAAVAYPVSMLLLVGLWERAARARDREERARGRGCFAELRGADRRPTSEPSQNP